MSRFARFRKWELPAATLIAGVAIGACPNAIATIWGNVKPDDKDWLDAVTMAATVGSAVAAYYAARVALRIAGTTDRRQHEEATKRAALAATGIVHRIKTAWEHLDLLYGNHGAFGKEGVRDRIAHDMLSHFLTVANDSLAIENIPDLIPLPNDCAHRVARARSLVYVAAVRFEKKTHLFGEDANGKSSEEDIRKEVATIMANVLEARDLLEVALKECTAAARLRPPHPGGEHIDGLLLEH